MKTIFQSDLQNKSLNDLPIRHGCSAKLCCCLGTCQRVVGSIKRAEYDDAIASGVDIWLLLDEKVSQNTKNDKSIKHTGRFNGTKEDFEDFCKHCKFYYNVDIVIDNQHEDDYWYSFEDDAMNRSTAKDISVGKAQIFFEQRDGMRKIIKWHSQSIIQ